MNLKVKKPPFPFSKNRKNNEQSFKQSKLKVLNLLTLWCFCVIYSSSTYAQLNISSAEGKITGKVITAVNSSHVVTNTAITNYHLGYFSGMQCIGDIDHDGLDDYAVCTERDCYTSGRSLDNLDGIAYIFFGRTNNTYWTNSDMPVEDKADMVLILNHSGWFGWYVSGLGDVNGDGISDFAINSPNEGGGRVYIFFWKSDSCSLAIRCINKLYRILWVYIPCRKDKYDRRSKI